MSETNDIRCIQCGVAIGGVSFYRADGRGPYCIMCPVHQKAVAEAYQAAFKSSEALRTKPLRWRMGPVELFQEVYYELKDNRGHGLGTGKRRGGVWDGDYHFRRSDILRWLPLADILDLIGGE